PGTPHGLTLRQDWEHWQGASHRTPAPPVRRGSPDAKWHGPERYTLIVTTTRSRAESSRLPLPRRGDAVLQTNRRPWRQGDSAPWRRRDAPRVPGGPARGWVPACRRDVRDSLLDRRRGQRTINLQASNSDQESTVPSLLTPKQSGIPSADGCSPASRGDRRDPVTSPLGVVRRRLVDP